MTSTNKPKKIINASENAVSEFVEGMLQQFPNRLVKLQNHHVLLLQDSLKQPDKVKVVSGGGSGHEPSHAGWLGNGMLAGAVLGGMFASPSVAAVLGAIRALAEGNPSAGVLLVVKNYTGDRLNFGMACETANMEGILCDLVVVADDCALPREKGITGARGVAGTVLVHKVVGAASMKGLSLADCKSLALEVNSRMGTMGVALDAVTVPGAATHNDRLDSPDLIELGLGIHGEAGMRQSPMLTADEMVKELLQTMQAHGRLDTKDGSTILPLMEPGDEVLLLVNNLGGTSNFEMSILANAAVKWLESHYNCRVTRLLVGSYMTSFNMHGASLTVLNLQNAPTNLLECLDAPCDAPAWVPVDVLNTADGSRPSATELPERTPAAADSSTAAPLPPLAMSSWSTPHVVSWVQAACTALSDAEPLLTKYDTVVGDGDCGTTMKRGAQYILGMLKEDRLPTSHPVPFFAVLADAVSQSMGGTSGVLLELCFRKMSSTLLRCDEITAPNMCAAFQAGVNGVSLYGGAKEGSRTMLDAMIPASSSLASSGGDVSAAASKAREGADGTASMGLAQAGRSNYLTESTLMGTPDPGAVAVAIVLEALVPK